MFPFRFVANDEFSGHPERAAIIVHKPICELFRSVQNQSVVRISLAVSFSFRLVTDQNRTRIKQYTVPSFCEDRTGGTHWKWGYGFCYKLYGDNNERRHHNTSNTYWQNLLQNLCSDFSRNSQYHENVWST